MEWEVRKMAENENEGPKSAVERLILAHGPLPQIHRAQAKHGHKSALIFWAAARLCLLTVSAVSISCVGWTATAAAASGQPAAQINQFALSAYCKEAQEK